MEFFDWSIQGTLAGSVAAVAVITEKHAQIGLELIKSGAHHFLHILEIGACFVIAALVNVSEKQDFKFAVGIKFQIHLNSSPYE